MRPYEVMIILDPSLEDENIQAQVDRSTTLINSRGGQLGQVAKWGKRRLAYEIQHHREGYYVLVEANAEPPVMAELDRSLQLADEVLRHKVIRIPDRVAGRSAAKAVRSDGAETPAPVIAAEEAAGDTATSANGE